MLKYALVLQSLRRNISFGTSNLYPLSSLFISYAFFVIYPVILIVLHLQSVVDYRPFLYHILSLQSVSYLFHDYSSLLARGERWSGCPNEWWLIGIW